MRKKTNPYLSPEEIATLLSPLPQTEIYLLSKQSQSHSIASAFSNSLILDLIFGCLSPRDISSCLKVCKSWNILGQSHGWRTISFHYNYALGNKVREREWYETRRLPSYYCPKEWQESHNWDHIRTVGSISGYPYFTWECYSYETALTHTHHRSREPFISSGMNVKLIDKNAHQVRSLKIDYSAYELLDLSFSNLTRLWLNCRFIRPVCHSLNFSESVERHLQTNEATLGLISKCPKLQDVSIAYIDYSSSINNSRDSFALRILEALRQSQISSTNGSNLYSLTLICEDEQSLDDFCDIIENCPSSLRELSLQSLFAEYSFKPTFDPVALQRRLASLKISKTITLPALQLLDYSWHHINRFMEVFIEQCEMFACSLLSCFPDLRHVRLPVLSTSYHIVEGIPSTFFSTLMLSCPAITSIDFGNNLLNENKMFQVLEALPDGLKLEELTMEISYDYATRILPLIIEQWSLSLQELNFREVSFNQHPYSRSTYIADILASCPQLRSLSVRALANWRNRRWDGYLCSSIIGLDQLLGVTWVCTKLQFLSIGINYLLGETIETINAVTFNWTTTDSCLIQYNRIVDNVIEFSRRLKSLQYLEILKLRWNQLCQDVPFDPLNHNIGFQNDLKWMGLEWSVVSGLKSMNIRDVINLINKKEIDRALEYKLQEKGITIAEVNKHSSCPCSSEQHNYELQRMQDYNETSVFERVSDDYKSRGCRRCHIDFFKQRK